MIYIINIYNIYIYIYICIIYLYYTYDLICEISLISKGVGESSFGQLSKKVNVLKRNVW